MEVSPNYPQEGLLVKLPLQSGGVNYATGTLTLSTTKVASATQTWQSVGITYAELRYIGVEVELSATVAAVASGGGALPGIELSAFAAQGSIPALYGTQQALAVNTSALAGTAEVSQVSYARLVVIGLRNKGMLQKVQFMTATTRVFAHSANAGTLTYLVTVNGILNRVNDEAAEASD